MPSSNEDGLKLIDRFLRDRRIARVRPFIPNGSRLLDIGCGDGALIRDMAEYLDHAVGLEPNLAEPIRGASFELIPGRFPDDVPAGETFGVITMLAVLEHLPPPVQARLADEFEALLSPGGRLIITVPSPRVDHILHLLLRLRLIAGIAVHEHYGFQPADTLGLFPEPGFRLLRRSRFQLGLNNLFVFERV
jgi:2-polyprenyl-3-methyl-5-hydroxy-6-metoxy-1,4-benzoquinol methylase